MSELKFSSFMPAAEKNNNFSEMPLDELPLTMSYAPIQRFGTIYNTDEALLRGTLFPELDKPFYGKFTGEKR